MIVHATCPEHDDCNRVFDTSTGGVEHRKTRDPQPRARRPRRDRSRLALYLAALALATAVGELAWRLLG